MQFACKLYAICMQLEFLRNLDTHGNVRSGSCPRKFPQAPLNAHCNACYEHIKSSLREDKTKLKTAIFHEKCQLHAICMQLDIFA